MEYFKHLSEIPESLSNLIEIRKGRVVSMNLSQSHTCQIMIMAVSEGEEVTSEEYLGDTLYYILEGSMPLTREGKTYQMEQGEVIVIPKGIQHAIGGAEAFKVLQIILSK